KISKGRSCAGTLRRRGDEYERRRNPLANAPSFIRSKKERPILDDRSTKCSPELVLIELWLVTGNTIYSREAIRIGVQLCASKKLICIAGVQRKLADRAVVDNRSQLCAGDVHERCFRGHLHCLRRGANLQGRIQCDHLVDVDRHILLHVPLETLLLELRRIVTGR